MTAKDHEDLLWSLASEPEPGPEEGSSQELSDELLERYRAGALDPEEEKLIEAGLASDRKARERLAELAGLRLPHPPLHLRQKILAHRPGAERPGSVETERHRWGGTRWWVGAAAAAVLVLSLLPLLRQPGLPPGTEYTVEIQGLAETRTSGPFEGPAPSTVEAYPDTRVRIRVEPRGEALDEVELSLYRLEPPRLERLALEAPLRTRMLRGTALIEGPARAFVGEALENVTLFIVAHHPGDAPPATLRIADEDPADLLSRGSARRAYPWTIRLLAPPRGEANLEEEE